MSASRPLSFLLACSLLACCGGLSALEVAPDVCTVKIASQGHALLARHFSPRLPQPSDKAPAVLLLHGIPGTEQNWDVAYALRDAGFHCLLFHYRGCWGSAGNYSIRGLPDDISAAFKWLVDQPTVDSGRLVVTGHSLGGYHALRIALHSCRQSGVPPPFEASPGPAPVLRGVAALCPLVGCDSVGHRMPRPYADDFARFLANIHPQEIQDQLAELTAIKDLAAHVPAPADPRDKLPVLVITGDSDPLFSPAYYEQHLWRDLEHCPGLAPRYRRLQYGDHALCRYRREVVKRVVRFATRCVGGCRPPTWKERVRSAVTCVTEWLDIVPVLLVASAVSGFVAGRYEGTPEGKRRLREEEVADRPRERTMFD